MSSVLLCIKLSSSSGFVLQDSSKLSSASTVCLASSWDGHKTRPRGTPGSLPCHQALLQPLRFAYHPAPHHWQQA
ncbi:unnamed protein product [Sphagnum compactum]